MHLLSLLLAVLVLPVFPFAAQTPTIASDAPVLQNPGFECTQGYHEQAGIAGLVPNGWTAQILAGENPYMSSTQLWATGGCNPDANLWEKLEGSDSLIMFAAPTQLGQGFVAPPFDIAVQQQTAVTSGESYSLSAWMVSFCGGSNTPSDCPEGYYISKMAGLDPKGRGDASAEEIEWVEDRRPHTAFWANLVTATTTQSDTLTVFLRLNSPFWHHGNHGIADAVRLVRSPVARITEVKATGREFEVSWTGNQGPDIPQLPNARHKLQIEVEVRYTDSSWQPWQTAQGEGSAKFVAPHHCRDVSYQFRSRAWAIQEDGPWPWHNFVGVWQESEPVQIPADMECPYSLHLPELAR